MGPSSDLTSFRDPVIWDLELILKAYIMGPSTGYVFRGPSHLRPWAYMMGPCIDNVLGGPAIKDLELPRTYIMGPSTDSNRPCAYVYIFDSLGNLVMCIYLYIAWPLQIHNAYGNLTWAPLPFFMGALGGVTPHTPLATALCALLLHNTEYMFLCVFRSYFFISLPKMSFRKHHNWFILPNYYT